MRILIAVLAIVGSATVTHARPPHRIPRTLKGFLEAMGDPHLFDLPPAENRSIEDFEANAHLVIWDATMQAENLYSFLNATKFNGNVSEETRTTVNELMAKFTQKLDDAHKFFFKTYDQVDSIIVYNRTFHTVHISIDERYFELRRKVLLENLENTVSSVLEGHANYRRQYDFLKQSGIRRLLLDSIDLRGLVIDNFKRKFVSPSRYNKEHLRVLYQYYSWNANGRLLSQQELDQKLAEEAALQKQQENEKPQDPFVAA